MSRTWKTDPFPVKAARKKAPVHAIEDHGQPKPYGSMPLITGREAKRTWLEYFNDGDIHLELETALNTIPSLRCACPAHFEHYFEKPKKRERRQLRQQDKDLVKKVNSRDYDLDEF